MCFYYSHRAKHNRRDPLQTAIYYSAQLTHREFTESFHRRTFGVEGPLWSVVLVQVDPLLLAQLAHPVVKLPGDVDVGRRDGSGDALSPEEPVDLGGGGEDAVAGAGPEHQPHVGPGQVEVT